MNVFNIHIEVPSKVSSSFEFSLIIAKQDIKNYPIKITLNIGNFEDIFNVKRISSGSMSLLRKKIMGLQENHNDITMLDKMFLSDWFKNKENTDNILNHLTDVQNVVLTFTKYIK